MKHGIGEVGSTETDKKRKITKKAGKFSGEEAVMYRKYYYG